MKATQATVDTLRSGDRVLTGERYSTLARVWKHEDGSVILEYKGSNPGLWKYDKEMAAEGWVTVKRAPIPVACQKCLVVRESRACAPTCEHR